MDGFCDIFGQEEKIEFWGGPGGQSGGWMVHRSALLGPQKCAFVRSALLGLQKCAFVKEVRFCLRSALVVHRSALFVIKARFCVSRQRRAFTLFTSDSQECVVHSCCTFATNLSIYR